MSVTCRRPHRARTGAALVRAVRDAVAQEPVAALGVATGLLASAAGACAYFSLEALMQVHSAGVNRRLDELAAGVRVLRTDLGDLRAAAHLPLSVTDPYGAPSYPSAGYGGTYPGAGYAGYGGYSHNGYRSPWARFGSGTDPQAAGGPGEG